MTTTDPTWQPRPQHDQLDPLPPSPARLAGPDVCQTTDAHGRPVCVRALDQRPCADCPDAAGTETTTTELDVALSGLDPEQEIRARALDAAIASAIGATYGTWGTPDELLAVADVLAGWIRTGQRPDTPEAGRG